MKKTLLIVLPTALLAFGGSLAFGAGSVPLHEHAKGTATTNDDGNLEMTGTVNGNSTPIAGSDFSGELTADLDSERMTRACPEGRLNFTGIVSIGTDPDVLVKKEKGVICVTDEESPTQTFSGTYTVDGADSTGIYKGAGGTGSVTYTLTTPTEGPDGLTANFTSDEQGAVILKGKKQTGGGPK